MACLADPSRALMAAEVLSSRAVWIDEQRHNGTSSIHSAAIARLLLHLVLLHHLESLLMRTALKLFMFVVHELYVRRVYSRAASIP